MGTTESTLAAKPESLDDLFAALDANGDGQLTKDEVVRSAATLNMTSAEAAALFDEFDVAGAGVLSKGQVATGASARAAATSPKKAPSKSPTSAPTASGDDAVPKLELAAPAVAAAAPVAKEQVATLGPEVEMKEVVGARGSPAPGFADVKVLVPKEQWFSGIGKDLATRLPLYKSDWTVTTSEEAKKIASATLFAYFTSVLPAVIFGDQLQGSTDNIYGLTEVLMSTGGMGILYSIFAGQGLVVVGVTGPVVFFQLTVWMLAKGIDAPFLQLNAWVNIWCGLLHIFVAAGGYVKLVQRVTAFSGEVFGFFISVAYVFLGFRNLVDMFPSDVEEDDDGGLTAIRLGSAFASLCLAALTYSLAMSCHGAKQWKSLNDIGRWIMQSYGLVLTLVACTAFSYLPIFSNPHVDLDRLPVPEDGSAFEPSESTGRKGWFVDLMGSDSEGNTMETWMVFLAILPAVMLLILFFFDHNVSSIMAQDPKFNLQKPPAYNYDFAVLGVTVVMCGIFGVPPGNGLIPQAPLHVRALAVVEYVDAPGGKREVYAAVVEKRWSNLLQSALCLLTVFLFPVLKLVPQAVLSGTFLYMGASGFLGNGLYDRLELLGMQAERRPAYKFLEYVPFPQVVKYTLLQFTAVVLIFFVSFNFFLPEGSASIAILFPLFIAVLIPLREYVLPSKFTEVELAHLDPPPKAEDVAEVGAGDNQ